MKSNSIWFLSLTQQALLCSSKDSLYLIVIYFFLFKKDYIFSIRSHKNLMINFHVIQVNCEIYKYIWKIETKRIIKSILTYWITYKSHSNFSTRRYFSWTGIEIRWANTSARSFLSWFVKYSEESKEKKSCLYFISKSIYFQTTILLWQDRHLLI